MNFTVVALAVIVIILIYLLYQYFTTNTITLAKQVALLKVNPSIPINKNAISYRYTYSMWLYVNTWDGTNYKPIFYRNYRDGKVGGNEPTSFYGVDSNAPTAANVSKYIMLYLDKTTPTLYFRVPESATDAYQSFIITPNFPLQTWTNVAISIDSNYIDFYINGKLIKSVKMQHNPITPSDGVINPVYMGAGWDGLVTQFTYQNSPISPQIAWTNFLGGSGAAGSSNSYNVNIDLLKNNVPQNTFQLF